jgi:putative transposase
LLIFKPETIVKWHRQGFHLFWRRKTKAHHPSRPRINAEIRDLIRKALRGNPLWGTPRIQAELSLLGLNVAESTVAKYRIKVLKHHYSIC